MKAYKSVDVLIKAFKDIAVKIPGAKLVIAGSGEEEKNLKALARDLNLQEQISFAGKISEQEKLSLLQRAGVLVNPSLVEGWGITTIEANACGVPVVAANVPGLRDSVRNPHTGYLVKYGDVPGFSQKILALLKDRKLRTEMGRQAQEWAKNFNWQQISGESLGLLKD
ncbi:MAG: glycosyltransferase [Patescibacteria group bacterium]|nr:glycosyltransferase [Patescibacteria group bacterium]